MPNFIQSNLIKMTRLREVGKCPFCELEVQDDFKDELSRKEFSLSGLCQGCQDEFFTEE